MKKFVLLLLVLLVPLSSFAAVAPVSWQADSSNTTITPLQTFFGYTIKANNFIATSSLATSTFPELSTTHFKLGTLSGLLKATSGTVRTATAGTDYIIGSGISGNCVQWGVSNTLGDAGAPCGSGSGGVTSVSGTANRITSTGGTTPVIDISATFEALLGKVANPLSQFASTTSAQLASVITDETGTGSLVFGTAPVITLTNGTGLPISTGISGLGTGVSTALGINVGSAGSFITFNGAAGTPSSITLTNGTGLPLTTGVTGVLPIANGGTATTTQSTNGVNYFDGTSITNNSGFTFDGTTQVRVPSGSVGTPGLGVGSNAGIYKVGASGLGLTNGTSGITWDGTSFTPNSDALRDLGVSGTGRWRQLFTSATTTLATAGGNVGIGTTSPQSLLEVSGTLNSAALNTIRLRNLGTGVGTGNSLSFSGKFDPTAQNAFIKSRFVSGSGFALDFGTGGGSGLTVDGTVRLTLDAAGNVGVGTTSPSKLFSVAGDSLFNGNVLASNFTATSTTLANTFPLASTTSLTVTSNLYNTYLTSTRVPYTTTAGLLTDSANMTFDGTRLTTAAETTTNASTTNLSLSGYLADSVSSKGTLGQVLQSTATSTLWVATSSLGISASPAGSNTQIQFNNSNAFGASANFIWDNVNSFFGISSSTPSAHLTEGYLIASTSVYSANGTYTPSANAKYIVVGIWGAGGAGGKDGDGGTAQAGSGGSFVKTTIFNPSGAYNLLIGKGGAAGTNSAGGAGGAGCFTGGNGSHGTGNSGGGGGGGSTCFGNAVATSTAAGGSGGYADSTAGSIVVGTAPTTTVGGTGGSSSRSAGGGGAAGTNGGNASGGTGGTAGTGASNIIGTAGTGGNASFTQGAGGSAPGDSGNGNNGTTTGGLGSGGAAEGVAGSAFESGGGGVGTGSGVTPSGPGAGGGEGHGGAVASAGSDGRITITEYIDKPLILVQNASTTAFALTSNGFMGLGTSTPMAQLDIVAQFKNVLFTIFQISGQIGSTLYRFLSIDNFGHIYTGGPTPTISSCTGGGVTGNDSAGKVGMTAGTACTLNFAKPWNSVPVCVANATSTSAYIRVSTISTTQFGITANTNITGWDYMCVGTQ